LNEINALRNKDLGCQNDSNGREPALLVQVPGFNPQYQRERERERERRKWRDRKRETERERENLHCFCHVSKQGEMWPSLNQEAGPHQTPIGYYFHF
jgi:hypothetical protein